MNSPGRPGRPPTRTRCSPGFSGPWSRHTTSPSTRWCCYDPVSCR
ncbi:hypothetical protein NKG94_49170 [Micromonospora sp. M12]